ncbi:MAG TPA: hypothetical protein VGO27_06980 [Candidatus Acidoferrum sp.]|jgi:hypothetical protein|nr:hypothetical protein [Candidatus Acidoferrum sp.]
MSETLQHTQLVSVILRWIHNKHMLTPGFLLYCDSPTALNTEKPPNVDGFYADVYGVTSPPLITVLGEAKTIPDIDSERSFRQICAFLSFLSVRPDPTFVFAIPWQAKATAKNLVRLASKKVTAAGVATVYLTECDFQC